MSEAATPTSSLALPLPRVGTTVSERRPVICPACCEPIDVQSLVRASALFPGTSYYRCHICRTISAHPVPSEEAVNRYYQHLYFVPKKRSLFSSAMERLRKASERQRASSMIRAALANGLPRHPGTAVVDCGAGSGALTVALRQALGDEARVISFDLATEVQDLAGTATETWCLSEQQLLGKLRGTAFEFDGVFFSHTLEHFLDPPAVLAALASRLRRGGVMVIDCPSGLHPMYAARTPLAVADLVFLSPEGIAALASRTGCSVRSMSGISPGPSVLWTLQHPVAGYAASALFLLKGALTGDGYFPSRVPVWWRAVLGR